MNRAGTMRLTQATNTTSHQRIFLLTLLGLLILRIPFLASMRFLEIQWMWTETIYQVGTYLLTTFLIWWEADQLAEYHIDAFAVVMVALFKPGQTLLLRLGGFNDNLLTFPSWSSLLTWLIALVFVIGMWRKRSTLPGIKSNSWRWLFIGMLVGLLTSVVLSFPESFQIADSELSLRLTALNVVIGVFMGFLYQLGYAAVSEEPLFRGFLWGFLRKRNWREVWIWLLQAALFTLSHFYYINKHPISFWIIVPIASLVLGWLAWRSRTIVSSMAAHGMLNATVYSFGYLLALWRLG